MRTKNNNARKTTKAGAGFTLVELILVMALMITLVAFIAPTLGHSFKQRGLNDEAARLLAVTEYARDEARSQGIPMQVWIDPVKGNYGAEAMPGYDGDKESPGAQPTQPAQGTQAVADASVHTKQYSLPDDVHFEASKSAQLTAEGYTQMIQFDPDGTPTEGTGIDSVRIVDKDNGSAMLTLTADGWGYQLTKEDAQHAQ